MPLAGLVDVAAEIEKLNGQLDDVATNLARVTKKLENINFVSRAPVSVVDVQKNLKKELLGKHDKLQQMMETLSQQG